MTANRECSLDAKLKTDPISVAGSASERKQEEPAVPECDQRSTERVDALEPAACRSLAAVIELPAPVRLRAFELLASQPISLVGLSQAQRDTIAITAVVDEQGNELPTSRFGDPVWNMSPEAAAKNRRTSDLCIVWPCDVPPDLVNDAKAVLYCALRRGRLPGQPLSASSVARLGKEVAPALRHLSKLALNDFSELRALHLADYIRDLRLKMLPGSIRNRLAVIDLVWTFPMEVLHPLQEHPWGGQSIYRASGSIDDGPTGRTGKTPVIPRSVQQILFMHCEARLAAAEELFRSRDAGEITAFSYQLTSVRDAVLYIVQITSGMRNSESTGITNGCWRTEVKNRVDYHWVRTRESKTGRGEVDFLVPPEALLALETLQTFAKPLQDRLADERRWLEDQLRSGHDESGALVNGMTVVEAVLRLNHIREIGQHLFLSVGRLRSDHLGTGSRIEVMEVGQCAFQLKTLARAAGTDWNLANHQCRRTFAYNVANSRLGRMGLVFLKWQLKHASLSWTQLYAANPYQDHTLYRDMENELVAGRVELIEGWLQPNAPLSGGAGKRLMQTRAIPVRDREDLLRHTVEAVEIRSTGHAWCLSGTRGCHGQGVYDPAMCGGCSQAIIDKEQAPAWQMIHLDNLRLASITDCGFAVAQKAKRAIERSEQVLRDLGVPLPTEEQADDYEKSSLLG